MRGIISGNQSIKILEFKRENAAATDRSVQRCFSRTLTSKPKPL